MNARIIRLLIGTLVGLALALVILVRPAPVVSAPTVRYHIMVDTSMDEYAVGTGPNAILLPSGAYTLTRTGSGEDLDATGDLGLRRSVIISATGPRRRS